MALELWKNREEKKLDPELFSTKAENFAKKIEGESKGTVNKSTQLRKFYDEIARLNSRAQMQGADWNIILPQVHMVVAKTAYAKGRNLISESFVSHVREGISQIKDPDDLRVFSSHLEAFMGFYKMYKKD